MSSISLPTKIKFAISLIVQHHYILWSCPFQAVNPKVKLSYIISGLDLALRTLRPTASEHEFFQSRKVKDTDSNPLYET